MHPVRIGRTVRALRRRLGWRQLDLARRARVSQQLVSLVETGRSRAVSLSKLERILEPLEADLEVVVRWRGGELDRIVDAAHAAMTAAVAALVGALGWDVRLEVTYAIGAERGSIDLLAFHAPTRSLLVVEVKVDLTSAEATLRRHDEKVRLARRVALERYGWTSASVSRLLVLPDASTPRRRVAAHGAIFDRAYPIRGPDARRWLTFPGGAVAGLLFLSVTNPPGGRRVLESRRRVRRPREHAAPGEATSPAPPWARGFIDSSGEHKTEW